jgi:hypothetical protein
MRKRKKDFQSKMQNFKSFEIPNSKQNQIKGGRNIVNDDLDTMLIVVEDLDNI